MGERFFNGRLSLRFNEPMTKKQELAECQDMEKSIIWQFIGEWQRKELQVGGYANTLNREDEGDGSRRANILYFLPFVMLFRWIIKIIITSILGNIGHRLVTV